MSDQRAITAELTQFYEAYIETFSRADLIGLSACFDFPWILVTSGGVASIADEAAGSALFGDLVDRLRAGGWTTSAIDTLEAWQAGAGGGVITAGFRRFRADGSTLDEGRACYFLRRSERGWRIASIVAGFDGRIAAG